MTEGNGNPGRDRLTIDLDALIAILRKANPKAPAAAIERAGHAMMAAGQAVDQWLSDAGCLSRAAMFGPGTRASEGRSASRTGRPADAERLSLRPRRPVEARSGGGIGERLGQTEGERRLIDPSLRLRIEDWAGPLAGAGELRARFGIARSTLQSWRRIGSVIGLLNGTRRHVFPLAQFVDGRPISGLAELLRIVGDPRTTWLWLVEPRLRGGSPLDDLKRGRVEAVLDAAREDFA